MQQMLRVDTAGVQAMAARWGTDLDYRTRAAALDALTTQISGGVRVGAPIGPEAA